MEKEFIPYEQALALKELGFDEPCLDFYDNNKELFYNHENKEKIHIGDSVKAPLYQQAFRWFREKHKLTSGISVYCKKFVDENNKICDLFEPAIVNEVKSLWTEGFNTYEEAELECVKKLIEIVKSK